MEDALVVVDSSAAVSRRGDDTCSTAREKTFENLDTDRAFTDTGEKGSLLGKGDTRRGNLCENVEVCVSATILLTGIKYQLAYRYW